jgi:hypothetical protein
VTGDFGLERRKESRLFVNIAGTYRLADHEPCNVYISQLSANGCRLGNCQAPLCEGDVIEISLGPIGPFEATVKWTRDCDAGVEFKIALEPAIFVYFSGFCRVAS